MQNYGIMQDMQIRKEARPFGYRNKISKLLLI